MRLADIWTLPVEQRLAAFVERYKELDQYTGCRTAAEKFEMVDIAEAIMPELIRRLESTSLEAAGETAHPPPDRSEGTATRKDESAAASPAASSAFTEEVWRRVQEAKARGETRISLEGLSSLQASGDQSQPSPERSEDAATRKGAGESPAASSDERERDLLRRVREVLGPKGWFELRVYSPVIVAAYWKMDSSDMRYAESDTITGALEEILRRESGDG